MGFNQGEIIVDSPSGAYFAGQYVDGRLVFELQKVKKFRGIHFTVKGYCKLHWTSSHSRRVNDRTEHYTVNHDSYEEYITLNMYLVGSKNAEHTLNPGKYEYPFKFQLPATCPSSFEGSVGHVRYELRAVMDIPYAIDKEVFRDIRVLAPLDLNAINCKDPASFEFDQTYCCWCCTSGVSETVVKIPVRGYCPGQVIPIEVSCRNRSSVEIDHISFNIKKEVSYRAQREPDHRNEQNVVLEMKKGPVLPHTDRLWQVDMAVPDMDVHNLDTCSFIDIKYSFNVTVSPSGCHTDDDDSCQIFFGTVPLLGFSNLPGSGPDQTQQTNMYPPAYAPFPQPIINQPVPVKPSFQPNSPFPPNPYPSNSPYPSPNPQPMSPYPNHSPYPNNPSPNPPYPNNPSPNPPHLSPYPNNVPYPSNPSPNPPHLSPYPPNNAPYPNDPSSKPPHLSPYPPNNAPYPNDPSNPPHLSPYPPNNPSPHPSPRANRSPYPIPKNAEITSPYPSNTPYPNSSPHPTPQHAETQKSSSPYPGANPPYPSNNSPYPNNNSPYPGPNPPYPMTSPGKSAPYPIEDKPGIGMPGHGNSSSVPLLPPGSVPYPIGPSVGRVSPFAGASAPDIATPTPDNEQKKPFDDDQSNSPFNPAFMEGKKETAEDK